MDDGQTVEYAVAVVVKLCEVYVIVHCVERVRYEPRHVFGAVHVLVGRKLYPAYHGCLYVKLSVGVLKEEVAEAARAFVVLGVHHLLELGCRNDGLGVGEVHKEHEQFALSCRGECAAGG